MSGAPASAGQEMTSQDGHSKLATGWGEVSPRDTERRRHRWGDAQRFFHDERPDISKTERACVHCGLVRVTRHESDRHWIEFWRDGECVDCERTPECGGGR